MIELDTIGKRVKYCREISKLSRTKMSSRYNISNSTLSAYETDIKNPSDKRLKELLEIFKKENVIVSYQWIKLGKGDLPREFKCFEVNSKNNFDYIDSIELMKQEEMHIKNKYPNAIFFICNTFDMEPTIFFGDWIFGLPINITDIKKFENYPFIFKINDVTYIKYLSNINTDGSLNIVGLNHKHSKNDFYLQNIIPSEVAPIFWTRRNPDNFM